jgi:hypothetical protein
MDPNKNAMVERDGFKVPLLGIPVTAVLQECDCCHNEFALRDVELVGPQVLCRKCRSVNPGSAVTAGLV